MERRDEAEEAERSPSAGTAEFPGIVGTDSDYRIRATQQVVAGGKFGRLRQLRRSGVRAEDKA